MSGIVYICHHIDTEGPLNESLDDLFERINLIFGIRLQPSTENLIRLQNGDFIDDPLLKKELLLVIDPHTIGFKKNWKEIEDMLRNILSKNFRNKNLDSFGGGWIYNWHIMDHVGFNYNNPRNRDIGFSNVFNFYRRILTETNSNLDSIHWHFHPVSIDGAAHIPATSYENSYPILHQILCRRLVDYNWFPIVNRAGFHSERIDSNFFLEQWIPFDPSNQAVDSDSQPKFQRDMSDGRYGDWRGALSDWSLYNPSIYDWRKQGDCNRVVARVLNMKSRHRNITEIEIEKAFLKAAGGEDVYVGITNHDWREMSVEIDEFNAMINKVRLKYPDIKFKYSESVFAFRQILGYNNTDFVEEGLMFNIELLGNKLLIQIEKGELFGPQPYLAVKTKSGVYFHDNLDFGSDKNYFTYTFDSYTVEISNVEIIKVASNDRFGNQCIKSLLL